MYRSVCTRFLLSMLLMVSCLGFAGKGVKKFEVDGNADLEVNNIAGKIQIRAGHDDQIKITYTKSREGIEVNVEQSDTGRVRVMVDYGNNRHTQGYVDFDIEFPAANGRLIIESVSGDLSLAGVAGDIDLSTVSGNVRAENSAGDLRLKSVSGDVTMRGVGAAEIDASSISGDIDYSEGSLLQGDYSFASTSGSIRISHSHQATYTISGRTISGSIRDKTGELTVSKAKYGPQTSISGGYGSGAARVRANSVSGSIVISEH